MQNLDLLLFPLLAVMSLLIILCFILCMVCFSKCSKLKKLSKSGELDERMNELEDIISSLSKSSPAAAASPEIAKFSDKSSIKRIGIEKFDAFDGITGAYSFSVALLNDRLDGIILTSLYGHETCNTYLREISGGKSETTLLKEEQIALDKAKKREV